ncbi:transglycosylase SLT domain-containing protein [Raineyella fluvialis]|uniref:Transglycosylase SLT domain-containing protein n=1 Tax=Raineyella fluvialis TaxID=2662261 RepID=A0A5Q2FBD9_9ACTN|nr:transglycosylase SLT domain-containing protein [Raineyella fluvialis]QGF24109.1 transglycosylase SLT domain-containing protein [Raineyella fluvialis]
MTAASGFLAAAVALTPLVLHSQSTLDAVPAAAATAATPDAADLAARGNEVTRDRERPALSQAADERAMAQQQLADAVASNRQAMDDEAARAAADKAAADKAAADKAAADKAAADKAAASGAGSYSGAPRDIAQKVAQAEFGWGDAQFQCYDKIIMHESEWNPSATNPSSGAYGIPQALPGSKMASAGADWRTNPVTQIRWGLGYVKDRYGSPCQAWSFKSAHGWY